MCKFLCHRHLTQWWTEWLLRVERDPLTQFVLAGGSGWATSISFTSCHWISHKTEEELIRLLIFFLEIGDVKQDYIDLRPWCTYGPISCKEGTHIVVNDVVEHSSKWSSFSMCFCWQMVCSEKKFEASGRL